MKIVIIVFLYFVFSCQPQNIRRTRLENAQAKPDSFLFYQPQNLANAFLDSMNSKFDQDVSLKMRLIPPPAPPAPKLKQVDGFRVQLFAGLDSLNAASVYAGLVAGKDSVYFFKDKGLFKIQLGDYIYRNDADLKVLDLRKDNFNGAWVVQRLVNIPVDSGQTKNTPVDSTVTVPSEKENWLYKIQVLVTADKNKAMALASELKESYKRKSSFEHNDKVYKVFIGQFKTREEAEVLLQQIKNDGFKDAWLVY